MIRAIFWRSLGLAALFLGLGSFVAALALAPDFATDRRALWVAGAITAGGAPLLAALLTWMAKRQLARSTRRISRGIRAVVETEAGLLPGRAGEGAELEALVGTINRLARELASSRERHGAQEALLRRTIDGLQDGVLFLDREGTIVIANRAAELLLGMGALESKLLGEIARSPELLELVDEGGGRIELPERGLRPTMQVVCRSLEEGGWLLTMRDVGELRHLERVRRDFVANVSHELRTPVAAVKMNAESLLEGAVEDAAVRATFLEAIARNAERLDSLLSDLLDLSSIEGGQRRLEPEPLAAAEVVGEVLEGLQSEARRRAVTLESRIDPAFSVLADRLALQQILGNLVENALHHGREGGRVRLEASREGESIELRVIDDGPGIEARHHARIFERFYRVDPGRSRAAGGTGLGLSIVRNLVEALGGRVGLRPAEPHGSIFWVRLPEAV